MFNPLRGCRFRVTFIPRLRFAYRSYCYADFQFTVSHFVVIITTSLHYQIITSTYYHINTSSHQHINTSSHHQIITSPNQRIITLFFHRAFQKHRSQQVEHNQETTYYSTHNHGFSFSQPFFFQRKTGRIDNLYNGCFACHI